MTSLWNKFQHLPFTSLTSPQCFYFPLPWMLLEYLTYFSGSSFCLFFLLTHCLNDPSLILLCTGRRPTRNEVTGNLCRRWKDEFNVHAKWAQRKLACFAEIPIPGRAESREFKSQREIWRCTQSCGHGCWAIFWEPICFLQALSGSET